MNRPITMIGFVLVVIAAVFYFLDILPQASIPLFVLGVVVALLGLVTGR